MNIPLMEYYREIKGYTYDKVSELSGIPAETVRSILRGDEPPGYEALQALEDVLRLDEEPAKRYSGVFCESGTPYQAEKGFCTLKDYYALPEDQRVELIDGVFYDMSAPSTGHQTAAVQIFAQIYDFIRKKKGQCRAFVAPVDVRLDCDDRTMVQPDVLVICDKDKITTRCIMGAPDFIIEILSDSTAKKDMILKLRKYKAAKVREYWMVDTKRRKVIVYFFEEDAQPVIYGVKDKIPVGIFGKELLIDFAQIEEELVYIGQ